MKAGIDLISFYSSNYFLDLKTLAEARGVDFNKFYIGIGQEKMALPPPDEDIVTMAASAAQPIIEKVGRENIELVVLATESCIDQSKAASLFVHGLLGLPKRCRAIELKEACYGATAGLQLAAAWVEKNPEAKALILASDIARYDLGSPGEPTQGCGAVAMLVSTKPRIMTLDPECGYHAEDVMDFWRPTYRGEALVDGKYSTRVYLSTIIEAWNQYRERSGRTLSDLARCCFHLPFTKIAEKAYERLAKACGLPSPTDADFELRLRESLRYNRITGNSYTASLYEGLNSLLDHSTADLSSQRIGLFSYGSGCMAEFFSGVVQPGYRQHLFTEKHLALLNNRTELTFQQYEDIFNYGVPEDGGNHSMAPYRTGPYRLAGIKDHKRLYEKSR
ncbi:MAG TPA: hydroxymethylglutaryl-CoA synthase [Verrucomicrobia bacterium]|nr:MAG: hydroxymethylglutaryl-CoA synthase [Lentisphaerae bacterium GWF2_57_35]HBA85169.1 hydroxymethylglutaryl-CoA synthase [Verrucomicrobiota bacterium]